MQREITTPDRVIIMALHGMYGEIFFVHFHYFEKIEAGLRNHLAVSPHPPINF
jgi:hypothetical protein